MEYNVFGVAIISLIMLLVAPGVQAAGYSITVSTQGNGYVSSYPSGILCGAACTESYDSGTEITLTVTPSEGHTFVGWEGACTGTQNTCTVVLDKAKSVTARFSGQAAAEYELRVYRSGGLGKITSEPFAIYCGSLCTYDAAKFPAESTVTLTAVATGAGVQFLRWEGDCTGAETTCKVTMSAGKTVTAVFSGEGQKAAAGQTTQPKEQKSQPAKTPIVTIETTKTPIVTIGTRDEQSAIAAKTYSLNIEIRGTGGGSVQALDFNVNCQQTCQKEINERELVTLTTLAGNGSVFAGWETDCLGMQANCTLSFNREKRVGAVFNKATDASSGQARPAKKTHQVWVEVTGRGIAKSGDGKIGCSENAGECVAEYEIDSEVALEAVPAEGHRLAGWEGACFGHGNTCKIMVDKLKNARAIFHQNYYELKINNTGDGDATIFSGNYEIACGNTCTQYFASGSIVNLKIYLQPLTVFEGWSGECTGKEETCTVKMDQLKKEVTARFRGPKIEYGLAVNATGPGKIIAADGSFECMDGNCKKNYAKDSKITLNAVAGEREKFLGWGGRCIGSQQTCIVTMEWHNFVSARFVERKFHALRIDKQVPGTVVSVKKRAPDSKDGFTDDNTINCGNTCLAEYEAGTDITLKRTVEMDFNGCGSTWGEYCLVTMNSDKVIEAKLTYEQESSLIIRAIDEVFVGPEFDGIPGLKGFLKSWLDPLFKKTRKALDERKMPPTLSGIKGWIERHRDELLGDTEVARARNHYATEAAKKALKEVFANEIQENSYLDGYLGNEIAKPVQTALIDLKAQRNGGGLAGLTAWIRENKQWYIENTGIMDYPIWDITRDALWEVFAEEIAQHKNLEQFLSTTNKPPMIQAAKDYREKRGGAGIAGLKKWIRENKQWYMDNTGITKFLKKPEPPKLAEITSIVPENLQITKPAIIKGKNFVDIQRVTINGADVTYTVLSENEIKLPNVKWGISGNLIVKVENEFGWTTSPLLYTDARVIRNANGGTEQCFGGVGKACSGAGPEFGWGSHLVALQVGCEREVNGKRRCWVAPGSIKHDNCCTLNSGGKQCGGPGTDGKPAENDNHDGTCVQEWDEAQWDVAWRKGWTHDFPAGGYTSDLKPAQSPYNRLPNYEGRESTILCAPPGHELRKMDDAVFCCSGKMKQNKKCE